METYLLGKNKQWNKNILHLVDWASMGTYMKELGGTRAINVLKYAHDWQNDGQQKETFYGPSEEVECPAKCGEMKTHMHFLSYKSPPSLHSFRTRLDSFQSIHKRLCTASVIFSAFKVISIPLRLGGNNLPDI